MKILQVHNFYQQPGGEDQVFQAESELLQRYGHSVEQYAVHNREIDRMPPLKMAVRTIWNRHTYREVRELLRRWQPDVIHCHNIFPIISPAIYYAARAERVPVVQTLHNYRLICPAATLFRDGHVCEDCVGHAVPYDSVLHSCYRGSRPASLVAASMLTVHRLARTWTTYVDQYIALTNFARVKLVEGGLPGHKISIKPNFLLRDVRPGSGQAGYVVFVGRLAEEKGLRTLLRAWKTLPEFPLRIVGDGPLRTFAAEEANSLPNVSFLGFRASSEVAELVGSAALLVLPSEWYEGFPMIAVEAMASGTPIVAADLGSLRELVIENVTGVRFVPGNAAELSRRIRELLDSPSTFASLRRSTRRHFEDHFTAERNYRQLMDIYERVAGCLGKIRDS